MHIYCLIDSHDFEDEFAPHLGPIETAINDWLTESRSSAILYKDIEGKKPFIGLLIETNRKLTLKKPIECLYVLSQKYTLECVIGLLKNDDRDDVCYFGAEEGEPDINEIANYLGLDK